MYTIDDMKRLEAIVSVRFNTKDPKAFIRSMGPTWLLEAIKRIDDGDAMFTRKWKLKTP